ncbi:hypothetical protein AYO20_07712 [Fonsecaea nubica]|uniref:SigF-like NTF2-like domain-containing protein n=1 Tax=Fonsecaea nubica TaxID=856822 RepID=A0A178CVJ8_9EURO|nr:hypothetical protein AYO20_07712 [Fonsecaea nubica]OAL32921.1 hypothetical protein AYO20_07712 [Fonsecaea nubica]
MIYRWYKILSPRIDVAVDGVAYDEKHLRLYVSIHQNFKLWVVPFYNAPVKLVTVLQLTTDPSPVPPEPQEPITMTELDSERDAPGSARVKFRKEADSDEVKYYIQSQNDLYQTTEFIKFLVPWGIGVFLVITWQFCATVLCVIGAKSYDFLLWVPQKLYRQNIEVFDNDEKVHPHLGAD